MLFLVFWSTAGVFERRVHSNSLPGMRRELGRSLWWVFALNFLSKLLLVSIILWKLATCDNGGVRFGVTVHTCAEFGCLYSWLADEDEAQTTLEQIWSSRRSYGPSPPALTSSPRSPWSALLFNIPELKDWLSVLVCLVLYLQPAVREILSCCGTG